MVLKRLTVFRNSFPQFYVIYANQIYDIMEFYNKNNIWYLNWHISTSYEDYVNIYLTCKNKMEQRFGKINC